MGRQLISPHFTCRGAADPRPGTGTPTISSEYELGTLRFVGLIFVAWKILDNRRLHICVGIRIRLAEWTAPSGSERVEMELL